MKKILFILPLCVLMLACHNNDYVPKPQAYLRIDLPEHEYFLLDTMRTQPGDTSVFGSDTAIVLVGYTKTFPFVFEANKCIEWTEKDAPRGERFIDLMYPQFEGVVFLTYHRLQGLEDLRGQVDTSSRLLERHYGFSSGVEDQGYEDRENRVYGNVYYLRGSRVASTCQFWLTDSSRHFLRGALFLNQAPNNDSLAPVIEYMQADIEHLVETLRWRD